MYWPPSEGWPHPLGRPVTPDDLSPVLEAMGVPPEIGMGAVRFSLGRGTTVEEIDRVAYALRKFAGEASVRPSDLGRTGSFEVGHASLLRGRKDRGDLVG